MLKVDVEHQGGSVYLVDVLCDKGVRHMGFSVAYNSDEVLDLLGEVLLDYRS